MPKRQTEGCRYPSRYSVGTFISEPQYITEFICEKKAKKDGKDLPQKFWKLPDWEAFYKFQITIANKLLKKYSGRAIIRALLSPKAYGVWSLQAPFLPALIEEQEKMLISQQDIETQISPVETKPYKPEPSKSSLDKLMELE